MSKKCPVCGAPMESNICDYCGHVEVQPSNDDNSLANNLQHPIQQPVEQPVERPVKQSTMETLKQQMISSVQNGNKNSLNVASSEKSKFTALLLCLFLGGFGMHRFYVGKTGTGLVYLFTLGLCGFGVLVDFIVIAAGTFTDKSGLPLKK